MIGDPSGRSTERTAMEIEAVNHNLQSIKSQIERIFMNHERLLWKPAPDNKIDKLKKLT